MKQFLFIFCVLLFTITSCQDNIPSYIIGVSQCSDDEWRHQMNDEIVREALFYDGVQVDIRTAKDDSRRQIEDIRKFIQAGVDIIIVSPNEGAVMTPIIEEAYDRGIPVIVVDRKILSDKYTAFIGADNYEIGKAVGNYIATILHGKGRVAEISGLKSSTPAIDRHQGFVSAISRYPQIELVCTEDAAWLRHPAKILMDSILRNNSNIDLVYAHNDRMAAGAYEAARDIITDKKIQFIGIDALPGKGYGLEMVLDSVLTATFIYPTGGDKVIQTAINILKGRPFERETILTTAVIDATNARVMDLQTNHIGALDQKIRTLNGRIDSYLIRFSNQQLVLYGSLVILILVAGLLLVVFKSLQSKNRLNIELSKQKEELENQRDKLLQLSNQLEEATHAKLMFFTNISHDFRTPLTLIADPIEQLLKDKSLCSLHRKMLEIMQRNVKILLRLVNQILEFRAYENGKTHFHATPINVLHYFEKWNESFQETAYKKHIHFSFDAMPNVDYQTLVDIEKLERIYFNLLSNAFKFTPENGRIDVRLSVINQEEYFRFSVANTGSLISVDHIKNIFNRFYKIDMHHSGSGIGLALVKSFVELHEGQITVESNEILGTVFTVDIPLKKLAPGTITSTQYEKLSIPEIEIPIENENEEFDATKNSVLIIDDNADIRSYIKELLRNEYTVLEASDGISGIRKAMKYVPNLIISDVMMPGIDGIECCRRLKAEIQTCHIPVILLTACSLDEQRIQGYNGGADSYISKPFNFQLLLARIRNLIDLNLRMKQSLGDHYLLVKENICDMDKDFVNKLNTLIDQRISDTTLNVEDLGREMGMSRVQLYRKLKSLTNYSPNELLRIARLKKAASLLAASDKTVSEIAYEVGFASPSYFTKCYKEYFGETPTNKLKDIKGK